MMLGEMIDCGREFERRSRSASAIRLPTCSTPCERSITARTGLIHAAPAPAISAFQPTAILPPATASSATRKGRWALTAGVDRSGQAHWLAERHVHRQEPCRSCWARYLCGGGCHHEVIRRGRPACDLSAAGCTIASSLSAARCRRTHRPRAVCTFMADDVSSAPDLRQSFAARMASSAMTSVMKRTFLVMPSSANR